MLLKIFNYIKGIILGAYYRLVEFFSLGKKQSDVQTQAAVEGTKTKTEVGGAPVDAARQGPQIEAVVDNAPVDTSQKLDPVDVASVDDGQRVPETYVLPEAIQEEKLYMHKATHDSESELSRAMRQLAPMVTVMKNQKGQPRLLLGNQEAYECCADNRIEALVANFNQYYPAGKKEYEAYQGRFPETVSHAINCTNVGFDSGARQRDDFKFVELGIDEGSFTRDNNYAKTCTPEKFEEYAQYIDVMLAESKETDSAVLVCCQQGQHRSASVIVYWLATRYNITFDKAYEDLSEIRDLARIPEEGSSDVNAMSCARAAVQVQKNMLSTGSRP